MPEARTIPQRLEDNQLYRYYRDQWLLAGTDNFTAPPAQNQDACDKLINLLPPATNTLMRRWGYRGFGPKEDVGTGDEAVVTIGSTINAKHLYLYQNNTDLLRTIVATAADGSGSATSAGLEVVDNTVGNTGTGSPMTLSGTPSIGAGQFAVYAGRANGSPTSNNPPFPPWTPLPLSSNNFNGFQASLTDASTQVISQNYSPTNNSFTTGMVFFRNTPTYAQFKSTGAFGVTGNQNLTMDSNVTVGNYLLLVYYGDNAAPNLTFTDGLGNSYSTIAHYKNAAGNQGSIGFFIAKVTTGGACTITMNPGGAGVNWFGELDVFELAGLQQFSGARNLVVYWDINGNMTTIFIPAAGAKEVRAANSRDYEYFVDGVAGDQKKWNIQLDYFLTSAANASGGNTVYSGTNLGTLRAGQSITITGFTNSANNGTFVVVSSTFSTVTVTNAAGVSETPASFPELTTPNVTTKWGIAAPTTPLTVAQPTGGGSTTLTLSAAANNSGGNTVYTGIGLSVLVPGNIVTISGFVNSTNNGTFTVQSSTATTVTVNNAAGTAEIDPATLSTQSQIFPTTLLNGWGPNAHVGSYEGGVNQGFHFGTDPSTTGAYSNPGNAFDGSTTTFASAVFQHSHQYAGCVWSFPAQASNFTNANLNILSEVPTSGTDGKVVTLRSAGMWYSTDGGSNWTQIYDQAVRSKQFDVIPLPSGTVASNVQVMAFMDAHDDMYHKVYEINITGGTAGSGPITLNNGRVYYTVFENSTTGNFSDLSPASQSTGALNGNSVPLIDIPVSSDPQVDYVVVLATADGGDPTVLYFVAQLPNGTTTFVDGKPEESLLLSNIYEEVDSEGNDIGVVGNDPPPNGSFPTLHKGRMFLAFNQFVYFSKSLAEVTTSTGIIAGRYEEDWPPENNLDISAGAEIIHGLLSDGQALYIGTERHVRRLTGDVPADFNLPDVVFSETGVMSQEVWKIVFLEGTPVGCMWLTPDFRCIGSDFNTYNDVGTPIQSTLNSINPAATSAAWAESITYGPYNFYILAIPTGGNTTPDTWCVYDMHLRKWYIWTLAENMISSLFYYSLKGVPRFIMDTQNGIIRYLDQTLTQDNTTIGAVPSTVGIPNIIRTVWLHLGDPSMRKTLNEVEMETSDVGMLFTIEGATTASDFQTPNVIATGLTLSRNIFGQLKVFLSGYPIIYRFYRFTFTSTSSITSSLSDIILGYYSAEVLPLNRI